MPSEFQYTTFIQALEDFGEIVWVQLAVVLMLWCYVEANLLIIPCIQDVTVYVYVCLTFVYTNIVVRWMQIHESVYTYCIAIEAWGVKKTGCLKTYMHMLAWIFTALLLIHKNNKGGMAPVCYNYM